MFCCWSYPVSSVYLLCICCFCFVVIFVLLLLLYLPCWFCIFVVVFCCCTYPVGPVCLAFVCPGENPPRPHCVQSCNTDEHNVNIDRGCTFIHSCRAALIQIGVTWNIVEWANKLPVSRTNMFEFYVYLYVIIIKYVMPHEALIWK